MQNRRTVLIAEPKNLPAERTFSKFVIPLDFFELTVDWSQASCIVFSDFIDGYWKISMDFL